MDRMRESVFATLGDLSGSSFLDLFAGSGIVGLEAASRGAESVVCIEKDREKFPTLLANVAFAGTAITCRCMSVELFLARNRRRFDIVFCDPPFPWKYRGSLLRTLGSGGALPDEGLVLMHFPREDRLPGTEGRLVVADERAYGRSIVRWYRVSDRAGASGSPDGYSPGGVPEKDADDGRS